MDGARPSRCATRSTSRSATSRAGNAQGQRGAAARGAVRDRARRSPPTPAHQGNEAALPASTACSRARARPGAIGIRTSRLAAAGADDMHSRLEALKRAWVQYVARRAEERARASASCVAVFKSKASELGNPHLVKLLDAIALVARKPARSVSAAEPVHGDRDGLRLPAGGEHDRPFHQPGRRSRAADRDHGRLAARRRERQVDGEPPAGLRAGSHRADRRDAAARAGRAARSSPTCSTSSRCSTRSRATLPSATR